MRVSRPEALCRLTQSLARNPPHASLTQKHEDEREDSEDRHDRRDDRGRRSRERSILGLEPAHVPAVLHGREHERAYAEPDQHQAKVAGTENVMCHLGCC
jgi:hypothetical protein